MVESTGRLRPTAFWVWLLVLGCASAPPSGIDRLRDPAAAERNFLELIGPKSAEILHHSYQSEYRYRFGGVAFVPMSEGGERAVVFLHGRGAPCGTGLRKGGLDVPAELPLNRELQGVVVLDSQGVPVLQVDNSRSFLAPMDADGDGKAYELVRWCTWCDYSRAPFLVIHDLAAPGCPVMLNVVLNPEAGRESSETRSESRRNPDGSTTTRGWSTSKMEPDRFGRWRFERNAAGRLDVVVDERKGDRYTEVARFAYCPGTRSWTGPAGSDQEFWELGTDPWIGARHTFWK